MGKQLVIAEKPSVAQSIAKVLSVNNKKDGYIENDNYIISWCVGHLVELAPPESYGEEYKNWDNLPIMPDDYNYIIKPASKKQFETLKKLMSDSSVSEIVCATDAGREGELIFRHTYKMAECKKPFKRLWISSLEDAAIKEGFQNLHIGFDYDNLYLSALCRERADWLVGINATRFFTTLYKSASVLSIGRVQSPTLAMIVERDNQIANFKKEKYYTVEINCGDFSATSEKILNFVQAESIKNKCDNAQATVTDVKKEFKKTAPPKLYDLTSLQRDANKLYGFTAQQTLESVQRLYDNKLSTYPRTDSRYLTEDMEQTARNIITIIANVMPELCRNTEINPNVAVVMNNKKVSDHHAIIPTANIEKTDLKSLTDTDRKMLLLIAHRLISATSESFEYESTSVTLNCSDTEFKTVGKMVTKNGFRTIEENLKMYLNCKDEESTDKEEKTLPNISVNQTFEVVSSIKDHYTQPPKPYTEDTLLSAMERAGNEDYDTDEVERKGLGTPATRANIIETIIKRGYVERKKKQLISTEKGKSIYSILPEELKSAKMTAEWENKLVLINKSRYDTGEFMNEIENFVKHIISGTSADEKTKSVFNDREVIGICPRCKNNIYESKTNFYCDNKDCNFILWKKNKFWEIKKKTITKSAAKVLLSKGRVHYDDLYSENTGKTYSADILLDDTGGKYVNFKLEFP